LNVWEQINPNRSKARQAEPSYPRPPAMEKYEGKSLLGTNNVGTRNLPKLPSNLTANGSKAWKDDPE
jgi:hypothetical protein